MGLTGWYFRVLPEGIVEPGLELLLSDRPYPQWTIVRANRIMHYERDNRAAAAELARCSCLAPTWQRTLLQRVNKNVEPDSNRRLYGETSK